MTDAGAGYTSVNCPQCGAALTSTEDTIICNYCGARLIRRQGMDVPAAGATGEQVIQGMRFTTFICSDAQGTGLEAFRMLIPAGWKAQGGVYWLPANPGMPAVLGFKVFNPEGLEAFEVFPNQPFYWSNDPMTRMTFPVGSFYFGNEVRPPMSAQQMLREIVLPRFRRIPGLEILQEEHLPDLPVQLRANSPGGQNTLASADGARIRIQYPQENQVKEEEIYGVVELTRIAMPGMWGAMEIVFWTADYLFSLQARSGQLQNLKDLFQAMLTSIRINPQWYAQVMQISQYMIQNQIRHIQNIGQLSRTISQTHNQISDMMMESYNQRQQVMDHISDNFSQYMRGVESYYDPNAGRGVELPSSYNYAWSNALGEYIVSNDPNFDPNIGSNVNWTFLKKQD